jgi:hypothetical protein
MSASDGREERLAYIKARFDRGATVFKEHGDFLFAEIARLEAERVQLREVLAALQPYMNETHARMIERALASTPAEGQPAGKEA